MIVVLSPQIYTISLKLNRGNIHSSQAKSKRGIQEQSLPANTQTVKLLIILIILMTHRHRQTHDHAGIRSFLRTT